MEDALGDNEMENQQAISVCDAITNGPISSVESDRRSRKASTASRYASEQQQQEYQETLITVPPDGGWGWMVVFGAFFSFLIVDGMFYSFGIFLDSMSEDLKCSKSKVSMSTAISAGVFCLSGPFAASLVNNYGYRIVGMIGGTLSIASCLMTSLSKSIYPIYFTYGVLAGIGFGMIYMPAVIAVGFYFERWRGIATGVSACGGGLGGVVLPIAFTATLERFGWRHTFKLVAALFVVVLLCSLLFRPVAPSVVQRIKLNTITSGNFFTTYHNRMYPTLSELTEVPTITLLQPRKFKSSEVMITTYPSSSLHVKSKDEEVTGEASERGSKTESEFMRANNRRDNDAVSEKHTTTLFTYKNRGKIPLHETCTIFGTSMRPMYRDDIFYDSSFNFLQKYKRTEPMSSLKTTLTLSKSNMEYHMSVTRVPTQRDLEEASGGGDGGPCRRAICTEAVKRTLATMLDYKLLKSPSFILIALNATFVCLGYYTTYIFIQDRAHQEGVADELVSWLIPIIGMANIVGRIACGIAAMCPRVRCAWLSAFCLTVGGFATILSVHFNQIAAQICYAVVFGSFIACIPVLRTLIIVETLGLDKLTNAVGLILMFQGVACLSGLSLAGALRDATGDYKWTFYFSGASIIIASLFFIPLQRVADWERTAKGTK